MPPRASTPVRDRIRRAALRLVREGGYKKAQIAAVAGAAGVAVGSVYRHFPSKAALCAEVFRMASAHETDAFAAVAGSEGGTRTRLDAALRTFVRRALRGRRLAFALIAEPVDPLVEAERIRSKRQYARIIADLLREGMENGEFPEQNADISAACLFGALTEALTGPLTPDEEVGGAGAAALEDAIVTFSLRAVSRTAEERPSLHHVA